MATKVMRVLYDFKAEEEGELNVKAGQLVQIKDDTAGSDGWTLVQMMGSPDVFGYVPADYITAVAQAAGSSQGAGQLSATSTVVSPSSPAQRNFASAAEPSLAASRYTTRDSPIRQFPVSAGNYGSGALSASSFGGAAGFSTTAAGAGAAASASVEQEFGQLFASHEEWFRAASAKRSDTYKSLLHEANDVLRSVQEAEGKSASALDRLQTLERMVNEEKAKWSKAITEEAGVAY